jgi:osmotically inducible protein OsmC
MATTRNAHTDWQGSLTDGSGRTTLDSSGLGTFDVSWAARTEEPNGSTSPEELIAAAHASCFSMAFSAGLDEAGGGPIDVTTHAEVDFQPGEGITRVRLRVTGGAQGLDAETFRALAEEAKDNCPVSQALRVPIELTVG